MQTYTICTRLRKKEENLTILLFKCRVFFYETSSYSILLSQWLLREMRLYQGHFFKDTQEMKENSKNKKITTKFCDKRVTTQRHD